jgi:ubiquitin carboxyl-terminal hydrolase L3
MADSGFHWVPLESNPEMLNEFARKIGLSGDHAFRDCFGLEDDLLCMIPQPCHAVIFLFPCTKMYEAQGERTPASAEASQSAYFMKQFVSNACGSIAVIHCLINNRQQLSITPGMFLFLFLFLFLSWFF